MFVFDNPGHAWDYIFAKMPHHISEWRYDIRRENVLPYELEFDMFYHLNSHIDSIHFAGLLCYWETDGFKRYSESGKANRAKILLNPTQGSRGIAQIQHAHELQGEKRLPVTMVFEEIYREKKTKQTPETKEFKSKYLDTLYNTIEQETIQRSMSGSDSNSGPLSVEFEDHCVEVQQRIAPSKCKRRTRLLRGAFASKKPYKSSTETNIEHTGFVSAETLAQEIRQAREEMREEMRQELREEIRQEVTEKVKQEMRQEMSEMFANLVATQSRNLSMSGTSQDIDAQVGVATKSLSTGPSGDGSRGRKSHSKR